MEEEEEHPWWSYRASHLTAFAAVARHPCRSYDGASPSSKVYAFVAVVLCACFAMACATRERRRAVACALRREAAEVSERAASEGMTERFLHHELKNRLVILWHTCTEAAQRVLIDEMTQALHQKQALMGLATDVYEPRLELCDLEALCDERHRRHAAASLDFATLRTTGDARRAAAALKLDVALVNVALDNMLSNAFKYGSAHEPPRLALTISRSDDDDDDVVVVKETRGVSPSLSFSEVDEEDEADECEGDDARVVNVRLELSNLAGEGHEALLAMGETELNRVACRAGARQRLLTTVRALWNSALNFERAVSRRVSRLLEDDRALKRYARGRTTWLLTTCSRS